MTNLERFLVQIKRPQIKIAPTTPPLKRFRRMPIHNHYASQR